MDSTIRINFMRGVVIVGVVVAVSIVTSVAVASRAYERKGLQQRREDRTIAVKGSSRLRIKSDLAMWTIGAFGDGRTIAEAYVALDAATQATQSYLHKCGFAPETIRLDAIQTAANHAQDKEGRELPEITGYSLSRTFVVTTPQVEKIRDSAGGVTELLKDGLYVASYAPCYYYTKMADLKIQILGDASADARARADEILSHAGSRVGELRAAHMGVLQITTPNSTETSSSGIDDTTTIDKDVKAVVTLTFAVER